MFIRANRDTNSDSYKINKLKYMVGKDLWTIAEVNIPELIDFATSKWEFHWEPFYIKVLSMEDYKIIGYPKFDLNFITIDSVERGVLGLYTYQENLDSLNRTNRLLSEVSYKNIDCDFKELLSTEELLYKIMNTEYRYQ